MNNQPIQQNRRPRYPFLAVYAVVLGIVLFVYWWTVLRGLGRHYSMMYNRKTLGLKVDVGSSNNSSNQSNLHRFNNEDSDSLKKSNQQNLSTRYQFPRLTDQSMDNRCIKDEGTIVDDWRNGQAVLMVNAGSESMPGKFCSENWDWTVGRLSEGERRGGILTCKAVAWSPSSYSHNESTSCGFGRKASKILKRSEKDRQLSTKYEYADGKLSGHVVGRNARCKVLRSKVSDEGEKVGGTAGGENLTLNYQE
ncbi:hypothetical protein Ancab_023443 [Ancistrocladus abbreviatus]